MVRLPSTTRYYALSYVWGQFSAVTETRMDNIDMFCKRGSITVDSPLVQLPETIRDALRLLQHLGERYLWVDRLCIVQDDEKNKLLHVLNMDTVFMNAYCTIVAADGKDANWGLPGVGSRPRHLPQRSLNFGSYSFQSVSSRKLEESHHTTRGWTFQEMFLARRYIVFSHNIVFWQCQKAAWQEDCSREVYWLQGDLNTLYMSSWPCLLEWNAAVTAYNTRNLTFPRDIQTAFAGIEKFLEKKFPGGFIYGLPEFFFDLAMLWQPIHDSSSRRGKQYRAVNGYAVPSWSWLGWKGEIYNTDLFETSKSCIRHVGDLDRTFDEDYVLEPLFDWYQVDPDTGNRRRIRNDHHEWRTRARESASLPDGWARSGRHNGLDFYTTASATNIVFQYPIPTAAELPPEPAQLSWPPYLQFRTYRAKFKIAEYERHEKYITLVDALGSRSGHLHLNLSNSEAAPIGQECELVAISRGRRKVRFMAQSWCLRYNLKGITYTRYTKDFTGYEVRPYTDEFYNVLWIKWDGDYAVRKALGWIEKSVWERQELEEIDVQLR